MYLYLVAIAWVYVVLLMAMTEQSVVAGVMTFLLYCVVPLTVILYLMGTPQRRRKRRADESLTRPVPHADTSAPESAAVDSTVPPNTPT